MYQLAEFRREPVPNVQEQVYLACTMRGTVIPTIISASDIRPKVEESEQFIYGRHLATMRRFPGLLEFQKFLHI